MAALLQSLRHTIEWRECHSQALLPQDFIVPVSHPMFGRITDWLCTLAHGNMPSDLSHLTDR